jgi:hypothetical protein
MMVGGIVCVRVHQLIMIVGGIAVVFSSSLLLSVEWR